MAVKPADEEPVRVVLPLRVETFMSGGEWCWRRVSADGTILAIGEQPFEAQQEAITAAKQVAENDGLAVN